MDKFNIEAIEIEQITEIINFLKSDSGKLLKFFISETYENRVKDMIYSDKETIFLTQGEVRAYSDILGFLTEENFKLIRESFKQQQ